MSVTTPTATMAEPVITEAALRSVLSTGTRPEPPSAASASLTFAWRALLKIKHVPMQLFDVTAFPIMFVVLYTYLFGGALAGSTSEYLQALLPGILVMTVSMITIYTGMGLNTDIQKGIYDRFRSLPIWRPAVLVGMLHRRRRPLHRGLDRRAHPRHRARVPPRRRARSAWWRRWPCCCSSASACRGCGCCSASTCRRRRRSCR